MNQDFASMLADQRERVSGESPASQAFRAKICAAERELARKLVNDPNVDDLEYSYRMHVFTYDSVRELIKLQLSEREEGQS
jgi:hypothetical protein